MKGRPDKQGMTDDPATESTAGRSDERETDQQVAAHLAHEDTDITPDCLGIMTGNECYCCEAVKPGKVSHYNATGKDAKPVAAHQQHLKASVARAPVSNILDARHRYLISELQHVH